MMKKKLRKIYIGLIGRTEKAKSRRAAMSVFAIRLFSAGFIYLSSIILARWLGVREFGIYSYVWTWVIILGSTSNLGFKIVMVRELPTYFKRGKIGEYFGLIFLSRIFSMGLALSVTILGVLAVYLLGDLTNNIYAIPLILALICVPLFTIVDLHEGIARANEWLYLGLLPNYLIRPILVLLFSGILLFIWQDINAQTVLIASIIASFLTALWQLIIIEINLKKKIKKQPKVILAKTWLSVAFPLFLTEGLLTTLESTDIIILQFFMQPEDIAVYYAAMKTTLLVSFIYFAVIVASSNKFAEHWHEEAHEKLTKSINNSVVMTFLPSLVASLGIMAVGYWFLAAYGSEFTRGYWVIVILSIGAIFRAATGPTEWMMSMMGQQKTVLWVALSAAFCNVILNVILIPIWGLEGAAVATALTMSGTALVLFMRVRKTLGIPIKFAGIL